MCLCGVQALHAEVLVYSMQYCTAIQEELYGYFCNYELCKAWPHQSVCVALKSPPRTRQYCPQMSKVKGIEKVLLQGWIIYCQYFAWQLMWCYSQIVLQFEWFVPIIVYIFIFGIFYPWSILHAQCLCKEILHCTITNNHTCYLFL